jgi:hypothetical protein
MIGWNDDGLLSYCCLTVNFAISERLLDFESRIVNGIYGWLV